MFVCELWPSTPHAFRTRSTYPSSPGRPTWYMISLCRSSTIACRIRPAMSVSASSQVTCSHSPEPRAPVRRSGWRIRSGVVHLVEGRWALRGVPATRGGVGRVALELADLAALLVHVGEQTARRLAVEAGGGDEAVGVGLLLGPCPGVVFLPVIPTFGGGKFVRPCGMRRGISIIGPASSLGWSCSGYRYETTPRRTGWRS